VLFYATPPLRDPTNAPANRLRFIAAANLLPTPWQADLTSFYLAKFEPRPTERIYFRAALLDDANGIAAMSTIVEATVA